MYQLVVVTDSYEENETSVKNHVERIINTLKNLGIGEYKIIITNLDADKVGIAAAESISKKLGERIELLIVSDESLAMGYLTGLQRAIDLGAKNIIEIDSGGSHKPEEIGRFLETLKENYAAFSSRFSKGGKNYYPLQRKIISFVGNLVTNIIFGTKYTDSTSGFNGYRSEVLINVFSQYPPGIWISATIGPYHFYQTESKVLIHKVSGYISGYSYSEVPITYGEEKIGKSLKPTYLAGAASALIQLFLRTKR